MNERTAIRLDDVLNGSTAVFGGAPCERTVVDTEVWCSIGRELARNRTWAMLSHWAEPGAVHLALLDTHAKTFAIATLPCPGGRYPALGQWHPPAIRLERSIRDLHGIEPDAMPDARPWLDHGRWRRPDSLPRTPYEFLRADGDGLHQIAVGPVHAGIIEPGHFRFTANGETVVRLEERLGYVHKGIEQLWLNADLERGARLAARVSGDSTAAMSFAFARAVEAAIGIEAPPRAQWLRALTSELERIANHLGDIGAICNDASFTLLHAHCAMLRERVLRSCVVAFGHRLMMDVVVPGGVAVDLTPHGSSSLRAAIDEITQRFPTLVELYDDTPSLQDRTVGTGRLSGELAQQFAAGGYVGRASGRAFDARLTRYPPYDRLRFAIPTRDSGDVNERVWIRILEIDESLGLVRQLLDEMPGGELRVDLEPYRASRGREGVALVEGFRGDIFAWVRVAADLRLERCHMRDPSWFQWPLLEAVIEGNIVADFPLCNKSFNCSYAGHDG